MARRRPGTPRKKGLSIWGSISIIVILALASLALVYVAFQQVNQSVNDEGFSTTNSAITESSSSATPSTSEIPEAVASEVTEAPLVETEQISLAAPQRLLALDSNLAVRSMVGACSVPGSIEFSLDGGSTWTPSTSFEATNATRVLRLLPSRDGSTFVVALNEQCMPQIYSTPDNGQTWSAPVSAVGTWYLNPDTPTELGAPGGTKMIGCEGLALSPTTDSQVGVLCSDGSVLTTSDGGAQWSEPIPVDGALALSYSKEEFLVASQNASCPGVQITRNGDEELACVSVDPNVMEAGQIAMAQSGEAILLWVGDNLISSKDSGQSWL